MAEGEESQLPPPPPGSFWNVESAAAPGTGCPSTTSASSTTRCRGNSGGGGGRRTTVAYVINEASQGQLVVAESEALQCLREACEAVGAALETLHFGKLDFGETAVLDRFYNAGACATPSPSSAVRGYFPPPPAAATGGEMCFAGQQEKTISEQQSCFLLIYFLPHLKGNERRCMPALGARLPLLGECMRVQEPVCLCARV